MVRLKQLLQMGAAVLVAASSPSICFGQTPPDGEAGSTYADGLRRWTVNDSASLRYISRPAAGVLEADTMAPRNPVNPAMWSPDRRHFFIVTYQGDVEHDALRYTLSIYDAEQVSRSLESANSPDSAQRPVAETTFETRLPFAWMAGIFDPRWIDNETVLFVGMRDGLRQLFRISSVNGRLDQLTRVADPYEGSDAVELTGRGGVENPVTENGTVIFTVPQRISRRPLLRANPSISVSEELLINYYHRSDTINNIYLLSVENGSLRNFAACAGEFSSEGKLSPDGRWFVFGCRRVERGNEAGRFSERDLVAAGPLSFWILDTRTGALNRVVSIATGAQSRIVWRADGGRVALLGALPPDGQCGTAGSPQIVVLNPDDGALSCVAPANAPGRVTDLRWNSDEAIVLTYAGGNPPRRIERAFSPDRRGWRAGADRDAPVAEAPAQSPPASGLRVDVREGANMPWSIVASLGEREVPLTSPDPALEGVALAQSQDITWQEGDFTVHGALVLPRDHQAGTRLPLVIQAGAYRPNQERFLTDGSATTIFASQALAAQGFAVLNIDFRPVPGQQGQRSIEEVFRERIDRVVRVLDERGLIDPARVGLVGFSQTGFQTHYLASHPGRTRLTAAIAADSWTGSYGNYVGYYSAAINSRRLATMENWAGDFWHNREAWMQHAPLFNVQNVTVPILFEQHRSTGGAFTLAETIGAYRLLNKPFEYFLFPTGEHQLRLPRERMASMGNNVSWMAFWLQGREIAGLQTEETYARWRRMRQLRDAQPAAQPTAAPATP